jgi:hypothetical protein
VGVLWRTETLLDRFNEEDGMALIVSLMVAFVILMHL